MIRGNRIGTLCAVVAMAAALFVGQPVIARVVRAKDAAQASTVPSSGGVCSMSAPVASGGVTAFLNTGVSSTDGKTFSGTVIAAITSDAGSSFTGKPLQVSFPDAKTMVISFQGLTKDGRTVTGQETVVMTNSTAHTGTVSFTAAIGTSFVNYGAVACNAYVLPPK